MKNTAIVRIIIWSIVALIFLALLILFLSNNIINFPILTNNLSWNNKKDISHYSVGPGSVTASIIDHIDIDWISGGVDVKYYEGDKIMIDEYDAKNKFIKEDDKLRYLVKDNRLYIAYSLNSLKLNIFNFNSLNKQLTVLIPVELQELVIENVSAKINIEGIKTNILSINTVSGNITTDNIIVNKVITLDNVSSKLNIDCSNVPDKINIATVSGNIQLSIPENEGFTMNYTSVSGHLYSDFQYTFNKKTYTYKNGGADINISSVSGDLSILKK